MNKILIYKMETSKEIFLSFFVVLYTLKLFETSPERIDFDNNIFLVTKKVTFGLRMFLKSVRMHIDDFIFNNKEKWAFSGIAPVERRPFIF